MATKRRVLEMPTTSWMLGYLGREIRVRREAANMTQAELGERTYCSAKLISSIEAGVRVPQPSFIQLGDEALGADEALIRLWKEMTEGGTSTPYEWYVNLESQANRLCFYEPRVVPGMFQTEEYARAVFASAQPAMASARIEERLQERLSRQALLERDEPPAIWVILDEAVLRRWPGGKHVATGQMEHLLQMADKPNVTLQVLPFSQGYHAAQEGHMVLLSFQDGDACAYTESAGGRQIVFEPKKVATLNHYYDLLRAQALSPTASMGMIRELMEG